MSNILLFLSLIIPGTLFLGLYDVLTKKILNKGLHEGLLLGWTYLISGIILLIPTVFIKIPLLKPGFWSAFVVTVVLNTVAQRIWYTAFKHEDASLISPLRLLTPPLVLISGYIVLGEVATIWGAAGVLTTVVGLFALVQGEATLQKISWQSVLKKPGVIFGLIGAFSFALSFPFDKKAVVASSALFFSALVYLAVGTLNLLITSGELRRAPWRTLRNIIDREFILYTVIHTCGGFLTFAALAFTQASYAASVKRLWSLWAVLLSGHILQERNITKKLMATSIMLAGILLTLLGG